MSPPSIRQRSGTMTSDEFTEDSSTSLLDRDDNLVATNQTESLLCGKFTSPGIVPEVIGLTADVLIDLPGALDTALGVGV